MRKTPAGVRPALTARERQVLDLLAAGHSNAEIAERLGVTWYTARNHVSNVLAKVGAGSREDAAAWWLAHRNEPPAPPRWRRGRLAVLPGRLVPAAPVVAGLVAGLAVVTALAVALVAAWPNGDGAPADRFTEIPRTDATGTAEATIRATSEDDIRATKEAGSRQPTTTPVPPVSACPDSPETCRLGQLAAAAIRSGDYEALLALAMPTTLACTPDAAPATWPLCQPGTTQTGYLTGNLKRYGFMAAADFVTWVAGVSSADRDKFEVAAIGCPPAANGPRDCRQIVLITVAPLDETGGMASGNNAPLVLVAMPDQSGDLRIVAAQSTVSDKPAFRGGREGFHQFGVSWSGFVEYIPVRLPE